MMLIVLILYLELLFVDFFFIQYSVEDLYLVLSNNHLKKRYNECLHLGSCFLMYDGYEIACDVLVGVTRCG